jgi:hypothetical protein
MVEIGAIPLLSHIMRIYLDTLREKRVLVEAWHSPNPPCKE